MKLSRSDPEAKSIGFEKLAGGQQLLVTGTHKHVQFQ